MTDRGAVQERQIDGHRAGELAPDPQRQPSYAQDVVLDRQAVPLLRDRVAQHQTLVLDVPQQAAVLLGRRPTRDLVVGERDERQVRRDPVAAARGLLAQHRGGEREEVPGDPLRLCCRGRERLRVETALHLREQCLAPPLEPRTRAQTREVERQPEGRVELPRRQPEQLARAQRAKPSEPLEGGSQGAGSSLLGVGHM